MFNFDLKTAAIYQALIWERLLGFRYDKVLKNIFKILFLFSFFLFIYDLFSDNLSHQVFSFSFGLAILSFTLFLVFWLKGLFFISRLKNPKLKISIEDVLAGSQKYNIAEFLTFEAAKSVEAAINFAKRKKLPVNSTCLFYGLLKNNPTFSFVFSRLLLDIDEIKKIISQALNEVNEAGPRSAEDFQATILEALKIAREKNHSRISVGDILTSLSGQEPVFKNILIEHELKKEDIENLTWWQESLEKEIEENSKFWEWKNLIKKGSLAKSWASGYTITLDRFSIDLSEVVRKQGFQEVIGHQKEMEAIERILARREINNVLLIGEPGTGRKSIVHGLAIKSALGQSLPELNYKRMVALDIPILLAKAEGKDEAEEILTKIFQEVVLAGNVILVINDFHNFVVTNDQPGAIDLSGIITSYLPLPQFQFIGITNFAGLHKEIERKPALLDFFEKVEVPEISERETLLFLERLALLHENKYKKFISYPALREIISLSKRYLPALPFPKKAAGILDEAMVYLSSTKDKILLPEHIAKIISSKTEIPMGKIEAKEKEILLNLENLIHQMIINQEEAVKEISSALRRARADVTVRKGPMGTFLFLGPTGVGKTETSKALAKVYFGSEERMIRLDMSEFQQVSDIPRLIGSPGEEGLLTTQIMERPFSLILLDEIEKAHKNILNLFLQVLDEGRLTDGLGRKIDFKNSIIIATSNAGYQIILDALHENKIMAEIKNKLIDFLFEKGIFRPEFINRFDAVVVFRALTKENLLDIAELMLQKIKKNLKDKDIDFVITESLKEKIAELGYDPIFGARKMKRAIQDNIENVLASALLSGELKRGGRVEINPDGFKIIVNS
ncbi:MAG: ATP-dependent Clp protease ATP-binding subunit [bacterium]|nr:ATP-dependent Clp protease ATP-binding subunit [bacterium]